ncbi:hypothetical protein PIB30_006595 [Stylosanthes scabra]|uniref:Uncharacterized protein n=1 Tax=Stylosanthes scabra TaxID=79078 RepID=A0ABU6Y4H4_9FABA|nr:hypothetical protein [Stylosanthes scabra]
MFYKIITVSLGLRGVRGLELGLRQQRTIGSSKRLWGFCFHVGQKLTSRLTVAVWRFIRIENPWVGDSHSVYYQTFQVRFKPWKVGEASVKNTERLAFSESQVFHCVLWRTRSVSA